MGLAGRYTAAPSPLNEEALQAELAQQDISPRDYACTLAERKAHAALGSSTACGEGTTLVVGSDTIVDLDGRISKHGRWHAPACVALALTLMYLALPTAAVFASGKAEKRGRRLRHAATPQRQVAQGAHRRRSVRDGNE